MEQAKEYLEKVNNLGLQEYCTAVLLYNNTLRISPELQEIMDMISDTHGTSHSRRVGWAKHLIEQELVTRTNLLGLQRTLARKLHQKIEPTSQEVEVIKWLFTEHPNTLLAKQLASQFPQYLSIHDHYDKELVLGHEQSVMTENLWQALAAVRNNLYHDNAHEELVDNITKVLKENNPTKNKID